MDLESYRSDGEDFSRKLNREYYEHLAGLKESMESAAIIDQYAHLFSRDAIDWLRGLRQARRQEAPPAATEEARRLGYLLEFATDGYLSAAVKREVDELATLEARAAIRLAGSDEGAAIPLRQVPVLIANEADRSRRAALDQARNDLIDREINPLAAVTYEKLYRTARELGYPGYTALYQDIKGIDLPGLARVLRDFLRDTDAIYTRHLERRLAEVGVPLGQAQRHDLAPLWRATRYDRYFPPEGAVPVLQRALAGLGIDLGGQAALVIDAEPRPRKSPRAFCAPVRVGREVMLVIRPHGGVDDYRALFHEAGHAEHYAGVREEALEYQRLGDNSVTEAFAFLLEHLLHDPRWLARYARLEDPEHLRLTLFHKLYMLRRYAAKLDYELALHRTSSNPEFAPQSPAEDGNKNGFADVKRNGSTIKAKSSQYRKFLGEALKVEHPPEAYLTDLDPGFYASQYLRAWIFEAQLRESLKRRFGREWYRSEAAGRRLQELWGYGQKYTPEELAADLGYRNLEPGPLVEEIEAALRQPHLEKRDQTG